MRKREGLTERSVIKHQSLVHHLLAASQLSPPEKNLSSRKRWCVQANSYRLAWGI
jgi:hypothetical protein